ncbi:MAG: hypothetical protein IJC78_05835 [Clostridia bacterium]|nr:hypothetical protein [Clostridia bacterium]
MKKMLSVILTLVIALGCLFAVPAHAGIIGEVITTDIVTYIDEQPIESYNINDYTYVIAEELRDYGFDVRWLAAERRLEIFEKGGSIPNKYPSADLINVRKDSYEKGKHAFDVYSTDIVTTLNGETVNAYNVDGQTLIQIDELSRFAYFSYNDAKREVKIAKTAWYADWLYNQSAKNEISVPSEKAYGTVTFSGDAIDGKVSGRGKLTEVYENKGEGLQFTETIETIGKFEDGKIYEPVVSYQYKKYVPYNGTDRRVRETYTFNGGMGEPGMQYSVTYYDDGSKARKEEKVSGGQVTYRRETVYDSEYRFGYRVVNEGSVTPFGQIADYKETAAGRITHVKADSFTGFLTDENGVAFAAGYIEAGPNAVPVKIADHVKMAISETMFVDKNDRLISGDAVLAEDILYASERVYLKKDGGLYQTNGTLIDRNVSEASADGGLVLYIKGTDAYYVRLNFEEEGAKWNDGFDLSSPVKVFEGAKSVSRGNRFLIIDENDTLWGWSSYWYGTPYENNSGNLFSTKTPIKLAEQVAFADSGTGFIAYVTTDGALYVMPDATEPKNKGIFGITEPTLVMVEVADISAGGSFMLILGKDGYARAWGENKEGRLGIGTTENAEEPMMILGFYEKK